MFFQKITPLAFACLLLFACNPSSTSTAQDGDATETEKHFGEKINSDGAIPYAQLVSQMGDSDSLQVKVVGKVEEVCQKKGCWMTIVNPEEAEGEKLFVKFKDYGFFMPLDLSGQEVVMDGYAFREVTSVDELRHYAEDAKEPQEVIDAITEPKVELKFLASGVMILDEEKN